MLDGKNVTKDGFCQEERHAGKCEDGTDCTDCGPIHYSPPPPPPPLPPASPSPPLALPKPSVLTAEAACCRGKYGRGLLGGMIGGRPCDGNPIAGGAGPFLALRAVFSVPSGSQPPLFFRFYVERSAKSADGERELIVTDARPDQAGCMSNCSLTAEGFDAGTYEVRVMAVTPSGETAISEAMGLTLGKDELARCAPGGPTPKPPTPATSALEPMPLRLPLNDEVPEPCDVKVVTVNYPTEARSSSSRSSSRRRACRRRARVGRAAAAAAAVGAGRSLHHVPRGRRRIPSGSPRRARPRGARGERRRAQAEVRRLHGGRHGRRPVHCAPHRPRASWKDAPHTDAKGRLRHARAADVRMLAAAAAAEAPNASSRVGPRLKASSAAIPGAVLQASRLPWTVPTRLARPVDAHALLVILPALGVGARARWRCRWRSCPAWCSGPTTACLRSRCAATA